MLYNILKNLEENKIDVEVAIVKLPHTSPVTMDYRQMVYFNMILEEGENVHS